MSASADRDFTMATDELRPVMLVKIGGSLLDWPELPRAWHRWHAALTSQGLPEILGGSSPPKQIWLLAGGGEWVETLRRVQKPRGWSDAAVHAWALQAMAITAGVLSHRLGLPLLKLSTSLEANRLVPWPASTASPGRSTVIAHRQIPSPAEPSRGQIPGQRTSEPSPVVVVNPVAWLRIDEPRAVPTALAEDWSVTSDSIAVRLAAVLQIPRVVLAKSCDAPAEPAARTPLFTTHAEREQLQRWAEQGWIDAAAVHYWSPRVLVHGVNLRAWGELG